MYIFPLSDGCCNAVIFWRGMKTYFSSLLMMLISSQRKTCKWNVWTQLSKLFYGGGKGSLRTKCWPKKDSIQLVTPPDFVSMLRSIYWLVTNHFHWKVNNSYFWHCLSNSFVSYFDLVSLVNYYTVWQVNNKVHDFLN